MRVALGINDVVVVALVENRNRRIKATTTTQGQQFRDQWAFGIASGTNLPSNRKLGSHVHDRVNLVPEEAARSACADGRTMTPGCVGVREHLPLGAVPVVPLLAVCVARKV